MVAQTKIRTSDLIDERKMISNIRRSWGLFFREGSAVEIRIFLREAAKNSQLWTGYGTTLSGYFDDIEALTKLVVAIEKSAGPQATYITLNPVDKRLASRSHNRFTVAKRGEGAGDKDILTRAWLMIDLDPIRPEGIAATEAEVQEAFERMELVLEELRRRGWPEPVVLFSGNGYHLLFQIKLGNSEVSRDLIREVLLGLQLQYSNKEKKGDLGSKIAEGKHGVKLDASVFNAARITKLYGTWSRKGDEIDDRLHRQSYILTTPDELIPVSNALLDAEAETYRRYHKMIEAEKAKPKSQEGGQGSLIARFNREHPIKDMMLAAGYEPTHGTRWKRPGGETGTVLVDEDEGKTFHFNSKDAMYNGHRNDAFDFETVYRFGGDQREAISYWAEKYGVILKGQGKKSGGDYVTYTVDTPTPEPQPQPTAAPLPPAPAVATQPAQPAQPVQPIIAPGDVIRIIFETFLQNMRRRAAEIFNKDFVTSCLFDEESGNARLLYSIIRGFVVYDHKEKQWYWFNNLFWQIDDTGNFHYLASEVLKYSYDILNTTLRKELKELEKLQTEKYEEERSNKMEAIDKIAKAAYTRSKLLCNITPIRNLIAFVVAGERLGIVGDQWDLDSNLLATSNAVIDLKTGKPITPRPEQYIRIAAPVKYDPAARCDLWRKTVAEILDHREDKISYIRRQLGYAMSGTASQSDFNIWYGPQGRNGKELILNTIGAVLGSKFTGVLEPELLLVGGAKTKDGPSEAKMSLRGRRIVWASETAPGRILDGAAMKDFSGGVKLFAQPKFEKQAEWYRTHTLFMLTNHLPHVNSTSTSEWDRIKVFEFPFTYTDRPDPNKPWEKLKNADLPKLIADSELPGVLNWLIEGYHEYLQIGLATPEVVREATRKYQNQEDSLGFFFDECCVISTINYVSRKALYDAYLVHMGRERPMGKKKFYEEVRRRSGIRESQQNGIDQFTGIGLKFEA